MRGQRVSGAAAPAVARPSALTVAPAGAMPAIETGPWPHGVGARWDERRVTGEGGATPLPPLTRLTAPPRSAGSLPPRQGPVRCRLTFNTEVMFAPHAGSARARDPQSGGVRCRSSKPAPTV